MFALAKGEMGVRIGSIDPSWYQGRGAFGGLVAGFLLTAMQEEVADALRTPRSATFHFCAPATEGPFRIATEIVRTGSRVTHAVARLETGGAVATFASASFCASRTEDIAYQAATMPAVPPPDALAPFPADFPGVPTFFRHFDVRFDRAALPFSGAPGPGVAAWVRPHEPFGGLDAAAAVLLLDALPPAVSATFTARRPVASVDFTAHFFERLPRPPPREPRDEAFHLVSIASRWSGDGYTEELRDLWSPEGILLAQCRQLLALL
jgi:acyl-CoA thioesterase